MKYPSEEINVLNDENSISNNSKNYNKNMEKGKENLTKSENDFENLRNSENNQTHFNKEETLSSEIFLPENASKAFEMILNDCGAFNKYQWRLTFICGLCGLFTSLHNMGAVYLAATPEFSCDVPHLERRNISEEEDLFYNSSSSSMTSVVGMGRNVEPSKCEYCDLNFTSNLDTETFDQNNSTFLSCLEKKKKNCDSWIYEDDIFKSTVVTEWDLVCNRRWLMSTTQASYMMGILTGAVIFSAVSDRYGRRFSSLVCCCLFISASISAAFSQSFALFLCLRFIVAAAGQGMYLVNYVILMESVSVKGRNVMGNISISIFTIGFLLLSVIAYFVREWRKLQLALSVPTLILLSYFWLLPESSRWLLMQGREMEGVKILKTVAKTNGKTFPSDGEMKPLLDVIRKEIQTRSHKTVIQKIQSSLQIIADLVRTPNMRRRSLIVFYCWFVVSMVYYGLIFSGSAIKASIFVTVSLSALAEIPATVGIIALLFVMDRRTLYAISFILGGLSCASVSFVPAGLTSLNLALVTFGKLSMSIAFVLSFMLSAELVPTHVRNISLGMASMCARIGSGIAPYIIDLLGNIYFGIPFIIFGVLSLLAGLLSFLLPATGKKRLPESIAEIEAMPR